MEVNAKQRYLMVTEAAYFLAEQRGFAPGHEHEDWLKAERQVDDMLRGMNQPSAVDHLAATLNTLPEQERVTTALAAGEPAPAMPENARPKRGRRAKAPAMGTAPKATRRRVTAQPAAEQAPAAEKAAKPKRGRAATAKAETPRPAARRGRRKTEGEAVPSAVSQLIAEEVARTPARRGRKPAAATMTASAETPPARTRQRRKAASAKS